ncbi:hypothetical protein GIB67_025772 [Kingdonia uniflora]|uniref:Pentatricopeptide repeat-containing protein n=1 Tax=Kingdonia uniflora TaxID=39325 RepID=A0A7J7L315_9MAGN|nr:hypothetical protein GIB67_025772 [Kingdonia uniflora]
MDDALRVFREITNHGCILDSYIYGTFNNGLYKLEKISEAKEIFREMDTKGCIPTVVTYTSLIHGPCLSNIFDEAMELLDETSRKVSGFCKKGKVPDAAQILDRMKLQGLKPDGVLYGEERKSGVLGEAMQERVTESETDDIGEKAKTCAKSEGKETMKGVLFHAAEASIFNMKEQVFTKSLNARSRAILMEMLDQSGGVSSIADSLTTPIVNGTGLTLPTLPILGLTLLGLALDSSLVGLLATSQSITVPEGFYSVIIDEVICKEVCLYVESHTLGDVSAGSSWKKSSDLRFIEFLKIGVGNKKSDLCLCFVEYECVRRDSLRYGRIGATMQGSVGFEKAYSQRFQEKMRKALWSSSRTVVKKCDEQSHEYEFLAFVFGDVRRNWEGGDQYFDCESKAGEGVGYRSSAYIRIVKLSDEDATETDVDHEPQASDREGSKGALKEIDRKSEIKEELYKIRKGHFGRIDNLVIYQVCVSNLFQEAGLKRSRAKGAKVLIIDGKMPTKNKWATEASLPLENPSLAGYNTDTEIDTMLGENLGKNRKKRVAIKVEEVDDCLIGAESLMTFLNEGHRNMVKIKKLLTEAKDRIVGSSDLANQVLAYKNIKNDLTSKKEALIEEKKGLNAKLNTYKLEARKVSEAALHEAKKKLDKEKVDALALLRTKFKKDVRE